jgi:hypothetical protein
MFRLAWCLVHESSCLWGTAGWTLSAVTSALITLSCSCRRTCTCVQKWLTDLNKDFLGRFMSLLPGAFRDLSPTTVLALLQPKLTYSTAEMERAAAQTPEIRKATGEPFDGHDLKRLQACALAPGSCHPLHVLIPAGAPVLQPTLCSNCLCLLHR